MNEEKVKRVILLQVSNQIQQEFTCADICTLQRDLPGKYAPTACVAYGSIQAHSVHPCLSCLLGFAYVGVRRESQLVHFGNCLTDFCAGAPGIWVSRRVYSSLQFGCCPFLHVCCALISPARSLTKLEDYV